jgi:hypothetical protein
MRISQIIILAAALLCGCSSFPTQMTGQYNSPTDGLIVIKTDGTMYRSSPAAGTSDLRLVGTVSPNNENVTKASLDIPCSPIFEDCITFSADFAQVTVNWDGLKDSKTHAITYVREP